MGWVSGVVVYIMIWWMVFFITLSLYIKIPDHVDIGQPQSAPENPHILKRMIITSWVAAILWIIVYALIVSDLYSFRDHIS